MRATREAPRAVKYNQPLRRRWHQPGDSVPVAAQAWAQRNGCRLEPAHHYTWPGSTHDFGEPVSHEVPANATMWRFFEQHPRR